MTRLVLLLAVPALGWTQIPTPTAAQPAALPATTAAQPGEPVCVLAPQGSGRRVVVTPAPPAAADLAGREALPPPGTIARPGLASPTRVPWVQANGWRMLRHPAAQFAYDLPPGKGALAVAEATAYGADALVKIDDSDAAAACRILDLARALPPADLPALADFAVVDDGSPVVGEVMNLLVRRNLLFEPVAASTSRYGLNVKVGTPEFPLEKAADPSAFALDIRRRLTDERRTLRVYGSEVVIARAAGEGGRARVHLLNYGGRTLDGLRIRIRGSYDPGLAYIDGADTVPVQDQAVLDGATEFSLPRMRTYAVVDLGVRRP